MSELFRRCAPSFNQPSSPKQYPPSKYSSGQMCRCSNIDSMKTSLPAKMSGLKVASPARMSKDECKHLPESPS